VLEIADGYIFHEHLAVEVLFPGLDDLVVGYFLLLPVQLPVPFSDCTLQV